MGTYYVAWAFLSSCIYFLFKHDNNSGKLLMLPPVLDGEIEEQKNLFTFLSSCSQQVQSQDYILDC